MPLSKRPSKKAASRTIKCPRCASRSYKEAEKLNIIQRISFIGCKAYVCIKCGKTFAG